VKQTQNGTIIQREVTFFCTNQNKTKSLTATLKNWWKNNGAKKCGVVYIYFVILYSHVTLSNLFYPVEENWPWWVNQGPDEWTKFQSACMLATPLLIKVCNFQLYSDLKCKIIESDCRWASPWRQRQPALRSISKPAQHNVKYHKNVNRINFHL
jgi:hypothetical protein